MHGICIALNNLYIVKSKVQHLEPYYNDFCVFEVYYKSSSLLDLIACSMQCSHFECTGFALITQEKDKYSDIDYHCNWSILP